MLHPQPETQFSEGEMATVLVPKHLWTSFLQSFTRRHRGWLARVEIATSSSRHEAQTRDIAFAGVTVEPKRPEGREVSILLTAAGGVQLWVDAPKTIELCEGGDAIETLVIQSDDGQATVLRFGAKALPARATP
jgi:Family of unknown function (DUF5335)